MFASTILQILLSVAVPAHAAELSFEFESSFGERIERAAGSTNYPSGVTMDPATGDIYVTDLLFNRIQRFDKNGSPIAMWDSRQPLGLAWDPLDGGVWAAIWKKHKIIKYDPNGKVLIEFGKKGSGPGEFDQPHDVSVDPRNGDLYVMDTMNKRVQVFDKAGKYKREFAGEFIQPFGIAVHPEGRFLVVANTANREVMKFSLEGELLAAWPRRGSGEGEFRWPRNVSVDKNGNIYVADTDNERLQKLDSEGNFTQFIIGPNGREGSFHPRAVEVSPDGATILAAAAYAQRIDRFNGKGELQGSFGQHKRDAGVFNVLRDVVVHPNGDIYASDWMDHRIRRFSGSGDYKAAYDLWVPIQTDMEGKPLPPGYTTNPTTSMWIAKEDQGFPGAIDHDADGNIWVIRGSMHYDDDPRLQADWLVRAFDPDGKFVKGFGYKDFPRNARMRGIAVERKTGHVYIANTYANQIHKFTLDGVPVWTVGTKGAGPAQLSSPGGMDIDRRNGELYVIDAGNHRVKVLSPEDGSVLRTWGEKGTGDGQFKLHEFSSLAVDEKGYVFVVDTLNNRIQVFDTAGKFITKFGEKGFGGTGRYTSPNCVEVRKGKLYVADSSGHEIEIYKINYP